MPRPRTAPRRSLRSPGFVPRAFIVPIPGTSHRHRLEENAAAASLEVSAEYRRRTSAGVRAGCGERAALPREPPRASGDLTKTILDGCDCARFDGFGP